MHASARSEIPKPTILIRRAAADEDISVAELDMVGYRSEVEVECRTFELELSSLSYPYVRALVVCRPDGAFVARVWDSCSVVDGYVTWERLRKANITTPSNVGRRRQRVSFPSDHNRDDRFELSVSSPSPAGGRIDPARLQRTAHG